MWDPDEVKKENTEQTIPSKDELFEALRQSDHARQYYGLEQLENGVIRILDLDKIRAFPEEVKVMLREFVKTHSVPPPKESVNHPLGMSEATRRRLDELYRKLDSMPARGRKYFKGEE